MCLVKKLVKAVGKGIKHVGKKNLAMHLNSSKKTITAIAMWSFMNMCLLIKIGSLCSKRPVQRLCMKTQNYHKILKVI